MMHLLATLLAGWLTFYAPQPMAQIYDYRLRTGQVRPCQDCVGMVALTDCNRIGEQVAVRGPFGWEGPFLVVDCGLFQTPGRIGEVDYATAQRWNMRGPIKGAVRAWQPLPALPPRQGLVPQ